MRIEKIEKVVLTAEEFNVIEKSLDIIEKIYSDCEEKGELERYTQEIITPLHDFLYSVEIEQLKK